MKCAYLPLPVSVECAIGLDCDGALWRDHLAAMRIYEDGEVGACVDFLTAQGDVAPTGCTGILFRDGTVLLVGQMFSSVALFIEAMKAQRDREAECARRSAA